MKYLPSILVCALLANMQAVEAATSAPAPMTLTPYKSTAASIATGLSISLPVLALGITIAKNDGTGAGELLTGTILSVGTAYGLKSLIGEERPKHGVDPSQEAVAEIRFLPRLHGIYVGGPEDVNVWEPGREE